jgi:anti-anti-sigma factor
VDGFGTRIDDEGVLWLSGELDLGVVDAFANAAENALDGQREFVIDLRELAFLDSTGIRAIVQLASRTERGVRLRQARPNVRKIIDLTGIAGRHGIRVED